MKQQQSHIETIHVLPPLPSRVVGCPQARPHIQVEALPLAPPLTQVAALPLAPPLTLVAALPLVLLLIQAEVRLPHTQEVLAPPLTPVQGAQYHLTHLSNQVCSSILITSQQYPNNPSSPLSSILITLPPLSAVS